MRTEKEIRSMLRYLFRHIRIDLRNGYALGALSKEYKTEILRWVLDKKRSG